MLWKRIIVRDPERILVAKNGHFDAILTPGTHYVFTSPRVSLKIEKFDTRELMFRSSWADYLVSERANVVRRHFTLIETNELQVAMVYAGGELLKVLPPATRVLFWRGVVEITADIVTVVDDSELPSEDANDSIDAVLENLLQLEFPVIAK